MTEEKKSLSPEAKWGIAYLVYVLVCILACYGAGAVQQVMRHQVSVTFQQFPYALISFAAFAVLGVLWAAEGMFAAKVKKIVMLAVRLGTMLVLLLLGVGWAAGFGLGNTAPVALFQSAVYGISPVLALVIGWLAVDTVKRVFRRA